MLQLKRHFFVFILTLATITSFISLKYKNEQKLRIFHQDSHNITKINHSDDFLLNQNCFDNLSWPNIKQKEKLNLYILGLFELSTKHGKRCDGYTEVEAAKMAINHINTMNILPYYHLNLLINDTQCDPGAAIDRFFHALYSKKTIIMLLGSSCSNVTESLANIVPYWNILQVSFGSKSPILSDRNKFPLFFRTVAPESTRNAARVAFIKHFKWKTVTTFSESENYYLLPMNNLITYLESLNITCFVTITFSHDNYKEQLKDLKERDTRIIIGSFSQEIASKIFCEVYKLKMYGEGYVWILNNLDVSTMLDHFGCPPIHIKQSTNGIILISNYNMLLENETSISGLTNKQFEEQLLDLNVTMSGYAKETYDAIWTIALTLKCVQEMNFNISYLNFNYKRRDLLELFLYKMNTLNFYGISGYVQFNGADRIGRTVIMQVQDGSINTIAIYYTARNYLDFNCKRCKKIRFPNNKVPVAQRILKIRLITVPQTAFYIILLFSLTGIIVCIVCLYFNIRYRHVKTVKLSSPRLNNIVVFGCILVYVAVILLGIDGAIIKSPTTFSRICAARVYLLSAGFSLAFGAMFAKTYRVHRIFTYSGTSLVKDKLLKDKQLIISIFILLLIDGVVVIFWNAFDPMERHINNLTLEFSRGEHGVVYQPQIEVCRSNNTIGWFTAIYGYKGLLLVMGVYMAWETRHVKVQMLNDSQYIGICVYCAVSSSIIVVLSNIVSKYVVLSYLATTLSILASTTITLILLFVPKIRAIMKRIDTTQDPVMQSMGLKIECNTRRLVINDRKELLYRMEVQNKVYKAEIEALDREIARLENLLSGYPSSSSTNSDKRPYVISSNDLEQSIINRASWPNYKNSLTTESNKFLSERRLLRNSNETFVNKLKKIFWGSTQSIPASEDVDRKTNRNLECYRKSPNFDDLIERIDSNSSSKESIVE